MQLALAQTLKLARELGKGSGALQRGLDITIAGDNDFYSQRDQVGRIWLIRYSHNLTSGIVESAESAANGRFTLTHPSLRVYAFDAQGCRKDRSGLLRGAYHISHIRLTRPSWCAVRVRSAERAG